MLKFLRVCDFKFQKSRIKIQFFTQKCFNSWWSLVWQLERKILMQKIYFWDHRRCNFFFIRKDVQLWHFFILFIPVRRWLPWLTSLHLSSFLNWLLKVDWKSWDTFCLSGEICTGLSKFVVLVYDNNVCR